MAKNTTGSGAIVEGATFVHPGNIGKGIKWNDTTKQYDVAISNDQNNMLSLRDDGLYYGVTPTRTSFYVDYVNGSDSNDGSKESPFKTVGKAIDSVEVGTVGSMIYLKEEQKHYFKEGIGSRYYFFANASYTVSCYGDKMTALMQDWYSTHLGYRTSEIVAASAAYKAIQPTLVFSGTTQPIPNDADQRTYLEGVVIGAGNTAIFSGVRFVCENTSNVSYSADGWFSSCFRGQGEVIVQGCTMVQRDFEHGHFYLANSTSGQLTVSLRYFIIGGTGNLFKVGQYPLNVYSSYDNTTDDTVNQTSLTGLKFKKPATASEIFALTTDTNPKSFITNK